MSKGDRFLPECVDTRPCYGRNEAGKCKLLTLQYGNFSNVPLYEKDGDCPFCKPSRHAKGERKG